MHPARKQRFPTMGLGSTSVGRRRMTSQDLGVYKSLVDLH